MKRLLEKILSSVKLYADKQLKENGKLNFDSIEGELLEHIELFCSSDDEKALASILESYAEKRRSDEKDFDFTEIKNNFREAIIKVLKESPEFSYKKVQPYSKELFDLYTLKDADGCLHMREAEKEISNFVYFKQWWKSKVTESVLNQEFNLATDKGLVFSISADLMAESVDANFYIKQDVGLTDKISEGVSYLKPSTDGNVSLNPSWIKRLGEGKIAITDKSLCEKSIELLGESVKGSFTATRESESSDFWEIKKS